MTQSAFLFALVLKATFLLAASFGAAALLRHVSAAARHFLWTAVLAALLLLPAAMSVSPHWSVNMPMAAAAQPQIPAAAARTVVVVRPAPAKRPVFPWLWLWVAGAALAAARFATGAVRTRAMLRRATPAAYASPLCEELALSLRLRRKVSVLEAPDAPVPLACGLLRPTVLLPPGAAGWTANRLRTVLLHELSHIRRCDLGAQTLGQFVCCLYWFHPLVWMAAARLRHERERACDDAVLATGTPAHDYAEDLVDLARGLARRRAWADAPAMAETFDLEGRVRELFDASRNRRPLRARTAAILAAGALVLLAPLASLTLHAQSPTGALAGVVLDPSGARVPRVHVTAINQDGSNQERTVADAAGEYSFASIPAGKYTVQVSAAGFKIAKVDATVTAGQAVRADARLEIGSISESVMVTGQKPPTVTPNVSGTPQRIRVGGNVQAARLIQQSKPAYPEDLQQAGVQGTVVIDAIISKQGDIIATKVVSTAVDSRLAQLALDAVQQWKYQPTLLNGEPVEVMTTIEIDYRLQ